MRVLFDTNIPLDVLFSREPHLRFAQRLLEHVNHGDLEGLLCATTLTTIYYLSAKTVGAERARKVVGELLAMFEVASVDQTILKRALDLGFADFEDAVLHEAAHAAGADAIVTRNSRDFARSTLRVYEPAELLATLRDPMP